MVWLALIFSAIFLSMLRNGASFDGAEQLLYSQYLALGYGRSQPPLYTWLLILSQQVFGVTLLAENILKYALAGVAFTAIHQAASLLWQSYPSGRTSVLLCLLVPEIVWEMQRNYSHSVLLLALEALLVLSYLTLLKRRETGRFALFGVLLGLMFLAKYNAVLIVMSLALADLWIMRKDGVFACRQGLMAIGVSLIVATPHLIWASRHAENVTALSGVFAMDATEQLFRNWSMGMAGLLVAALSLIVLPILFGGVVLGRRGAASLIRQVRFNRKDPGSVMLLSAILFLGLSLLLALCANATTIRPRWLLPVVVPFVVWFGGELHHRVPRTLPILRRMAVWIATIACAGLAIEELRPQARTAFDYERLAKDLHDNMQPDAIVFDEYQTFANLRLSDPHLLLVNPAIPRLPDLTPVTHPVALWADDEDKGLAVLHFASRLGLSPVPGAEPVEFTLSRRFGSPKRIFAQKLRTETEITGKPAD